MQAWQGFRYFADAFRIQSSSDELKEGTGML
jgi:hypothetical protein